MRTGFFTVIKPGILSLIQDRGRRGYAHDGISQSGVLDLWSAYWANKLCGNPLYSALIEVSMGGLELEASDSTLIAVSGADNVLKINGQPFESWQSVRIKAGDIVSVGFSSTAMRSYLAVRGGFQVNAAFGSVATNVREGIGGITGSGQALGKHDLLPYYPSAANAELTLSPRWRNWWKEDLELLSPQHFRLTPSHQYYDFPKTLRRSLLSEAFCVSQDISRMAYRLSGNELQHELPGMLSEATTLGDIQVPPNGHPIILLNDRQTLGGYSKLGALTNVDCWRLSQLKPNDVVRFQLTSVVRARKRLIELHRMMQELSLQRIS
ncbi:biotin-dependent carboxyltransferase family protein [Alteromonas sp. a30]|uniref:5-oxoprolinase subunit C family protein n=1 Tax=Alteromonas sp. a30 TaxID=2730917 RepID=UPI00228324D4|nr:biotin-dependent carboxyltransferase family protein [Alteromonas sp. a30]MCY7296348.1 biotin-dependent carboxyltransferase family protein [Alteromonas sp. a30]